jgi:peptidyl-prolyl cis-trans isomerase D
MEAFRNQGLKSAIYGTLVIAIGIVFVVQFNKSGGIVKKGSSTECVAEVRGVCISPRDFKSTMALLQFSGRLEENSIKQLQLRRRIVDGLVERTLLEQDADRLGVSISDDDLNSELIAGHALFSLGVETPPLVTYQLRLPNDRPMRQLPVKTNGQFDKKAYAKALRLYVLQGEAEFREMQRSEQIAARMRDVVRTRVRLAEDEAFDAYAHDTAAVSAKFVKISRPWLARYVIPRGKEAIDAFIASHKEQIDTTYESRKAQFTGECRRARHVLIKASHAASDDEKVAARKRIDEAAERIKKGERFEDVAREMSDDTSAIDGGDLGCVSKGKMVKPFEESVFSLKPGDVSSVVETEFGFHIIKVEAILTGAELEAQARREIARDLMLGTESETKAAEVGKQILAAAAGGKPLDEAAKGVIDALLADAARGTKPAKKDEKKPEKKDEKKPEKKDEKAPEKKDEKQDDKKEEPRGPRGPLDDPDAPKVEEVKDFTAEAAPRNGVDVAASAFGLKNIGDVTPDLIKLDSGYAVLQLTGRKPASREAFAKERERYTAGMLAAKQHDAIVAYVGRLREVAKSEIKINQSYLAEKALPDEPSE